MTRRSPSRPSRKLLETTCLALFLLASSAPAAADEEYVRQHYAKFEHRIPMRDGARLFTAVYVPYDRSRAYPFLLYRTPYSVSPYGADRYPSYLGPGDRFLRSGYIFVYQDVRGRYLSEGRFVNMTPHVAEKRELQIDESTDTHDTLEWLIENIEGHNGKAGQWGISYPGFYTAAGAIDTYPALVAVSPQAPIADWFQDDFHHHGAFFLPHAFNFLASFGKPRPEPTTEREPRFDHGTPDGYRFFLDLGPLKNVESRYFQGGIPFWSRIAEHPDYDEFWQRRNLLPHLRNIRCAVLTVGGWFDAEDLYGPLKIYRTIEEKNPEIRNKLVMGPWAHGDWGRRSGEAVGDISFGASTSEFFRERIQFPFFEHHLKGAGDPELPEAYVFETGVNRWRAFETWPPPGLERRKLYLRAGGRLAFEPPEESGESEERMEAYDGFTSDPAKPVPFSEDIDPGMTRAYMTDDQRFASRRPDVLVYRTEVLEEDLTLAGPIQAELRVSTSRRAADWVVKVIDVFPPDTPGEGARGGKLGGYQMMVRSEVIRGRFRNCYEHPEPFVPGKVTRVAFELQDVFHTFQRGHRVMVHIQSTWFPLVDRNPQTWVPNIFEAEEEDFVRATHRVYRSSDHPTRLDVGVLAGPAP